MAIRRGGRKRQAYQGIVYGKPKHHGVNHLKPPRGLQVVAEGRVGRTHPNLRVLNSYWVNSDASFKYYEVICVDPQHNAIRNDPRINWICDANKKHREMRGLTSAGRISRGLRKKGHRAKKIQGGSSFATWKRTNTVKFKRYRSKVRT